MIRRIIKCFLVLALSIVLVSCSDENSTFQIVFIDVGQGDSALVMCDGESMIIDGGNKDQSSQVIKVIDENRVTALKYVVLSHPHNDHYGGLIDVMHQGYKIGKVICNSDGKGKDNEQDDSNDPGKYSGFQNFVAAVGDNGKTITVPKKGQTYRLGSAKIEVISTGSKTNNGNNSLVLLITYKDYSFMFTGDMPVAQQKEYFEEANEKYGDVSKAPSLTVLKVPHHGAELFEENLNYGFLKAVNPQYAIISADKSSQYHHPSSLVLQRLDDNDSKIYRTDLLGNIIVTIQDDVFRIEPKLTGEELLGY